MALRLVITLCALLLSQIAFCQHSLQLMDSLAYPKTVLKSGSVKIHGDTIFTLSYRHGAKAWVGKNLIRKTKLPLPYRRIKSNPLISLGGRFWLDGNTGYCHEVFNDHIYTYDIWNDGLTPYERVTVKSHASFSQASNRVYYLHQGTVWSKHGGYPNFAYAALVAVQPTACKITRVGKCPLFMAQIFNQDRSFLSGRCSAQDQDTVFTSHRGWPTIYRYLNGQLVDSTKSIANFPHQFISETALYFDEGIAVDVERISQLAAKEPLEVGLYCLSNFVVRICLNKGLYSALIYDRKCNYIQSIDFVMDTKFEFVCLDPKSGLLCVGSRQGRRLWVRRYQLAVYQP